MIYKILDSKLDKLSKQCSKIRNKGADILFAVGEPCVIEAIDNPLIKAPAHYVEVSGFYKINGWIFVATIEHTSNGNIIRCVVSSLESSIPEKYKTCGPECEHCHQIRNRKDTYLIYNDENKEWKQVGKSCLKDYTDGLDAEICAEMASFFKSVETADQGITSDFGMGSSNLIDGILFKQYAYSLIKKEGYNKQQTIDKALSNMLDKDKIVKASIEELEPIDEYAKSISDEYGYMRNAKIAWLKKYLEYRDLALVASFISVYFKNQAELKKQAQNRELTNYVGNIGDKVEIDVKSMRVLYTKDNRAFSYYAIPSFVYEIIDTDGNTYICDSVKSLEGSKKLKATIKGYKEYRGIKQTVITRVKVID